MKKVMLVSNDTHPEMVSGAEKVLLMVGLSCLEQQLKVVWISPKPGLSCDRAKQMGMEVNIVSYPLLWNLIHDPDQLDEDCQWIQQNAKESALDYLIAAQSPDLIIANSAINALPAIIANQRQIPLWWYIHEVIPNLQAIDSLLSLIHTNANRILVPSQAVLRSISRNNNKSHKINLLPYVIETPSLQLIQDKRDIVRSINGWTQEHLVIGWFGTIYKGKGLQEIIRASAYMKYMEKDTIIVAAGNVVDHHYFQICQYEAQHIDPVKFQYLGILPHIEEMLPAVDLVVVPSLVEDAFPNVALEAMAFGKCVVAYDSGGLNEIIVNGETGFLVGKGNVGSLGLLIKELSSDPIKRDAAGLKGREQAIRKFNFNSFKAKINQMIVS
jgi:glycosyltransferase involved in cell wall biosynthesis